MTVKKQAAAAVADVKPEEATLAAALQAKLNKAEAQIKALQEELSLTREQLDECRTDRDEARTALAAQETEAEAGLSAEPKFSVGKNPPADDAEVVAVKSRHGHAFWRAGYQVQADWTFVRRADFEAAEVARLIGDRMVDAREALLLEDAA